MFYVHCNGTGKQTSLKTRNEAEARNLLASYNESANTAQANRVIASACKIRRAGQSAKASE